MAKEVVLSRFFMENKNNARRITLQGTARYTTSKQDEYVKAKNDNNEKYFKFSKFVEGTNNNESSVFAQDKDHSSTILDISNKRKDPVQSILIEKTNNSSLHLHKLQENCSSHCKLQKNRKSEIFKGFSLEEFNTSERILRSIYRKIDEVCPEFRNKKPKAKLSCRTKNRVSNVQTVAKYNNKKKERINDRLTKSGHSNKIKQSGIKSKPADVKNRSLQTRSRNIYTGDYVSKSKKTAFKIALKGFTVEEIDKSIKIYELLKSVRRHEKISKGDSKLNFKKLHKFSTKFESVSEIKIKSVVSNQLQNQRESHTEVENLRKDLLDTFADKPLKCVKDEPSEHIKDEPPDNLDCLKIEKCFSQQNQMENHTQVETVRKNLLDTFLDKPLECAKDEPLEHLKDEPLDNFDCLKVEKYFSRSNCFGICRSLQNHESVTNCCDRCVKNDDVESLLSTNVKIKTELDYDMNLKSSNHYGSIKEDINSGFDQSESNNSSYEHNKLPVEDRKVLPRDICQEFTNRSAIDLKNEGHHQKYITGTPKDHQQIWPDTKPKTQLPGATRYVYVPKFHPPRSPHNLIEEVLYHDPWALLVATIFLNKTSLTLARPYILAFLRDYADPFQVVNAEPQDLEKYFVNIGLKKRSTQVWRMSHDFLHKRWNDVGELYGIGKYGQDAYRMFCLGDFNVQPKDRFLKIYKAWYEMTEEVERRKLNSSGREGCLEGCVGDVSRNTSSYGCLDDG